MKRVVSQMHSRATDFRGQSPSTLQCRQLLSVRINVESLWHTLVPVMLTSPCDMSCSPSLAGVRLAI